MIIDVHVHATSLALVSDPRNRTFMERSAECLAADDAIGLLLERMDQGGIDRACLMGPTHGNGIQLANDDVRKLVARDPQRLIGFVGVDPIVQSSSQVRETIVEAATEWGFRGVGELGGVDLLDPRCEVIYETCIQVGLPLLLHTGVGLPSFLLKYGTPLVVEELANRYPELTIVAAHAGIPWVAESVAVAARNENVWLDLSALPASHERAVDMVLSLALSHGLEDRLLFGSDFPVVDPARYVKKLQRVGAPPLLRWLLRLPRITPAVRRKILGDNAARLLRL